jgi:hypothetical protein
MFWTTLKWGCTVLLVVFAMALFRAATPGHEEPDKGGPAISANPPAPGDNPPPKKFNF